MAGTNVAWRLVFGISILSGLSGVLAAEPATTQPGQPFTLRVLDDATGQPISGAKVSFDCSPGKAFKTATDANGVVSYAFPQNTQYAFVSVQDDKHVPMRLSWRPGTEKGEDHYDLRLPTGTTIGGRVVDDAGAAVKEARVVFELYDPDAKTPWPHARPDVSYKDVKTDADGKWTYAKMPADINRIELGVWCHGYVANDGNEGYFPIDKVGNVAALRDGTHVLTLKRGVKINGRVVDEQGQPLANANVGMGGDRVASNSVPTVKTDTDGRFTLAAVPNVAVTLTAKAKNHAPELVTFSMPETPKDLTFTLGPSKTLKGRVVDHDGKPIASAGVAVDGWRGARTLDKRLSTDADGRFSWSDAPSDTVLVDVFQTGYADKRKIPMTADKDNVVTLTPPLKITGTVVDDATGRPVTDFRVVRGIDFKERGNGISWQRSDRDDIDTHADGTFAVTFSYPYPGNPVRVEAPGYLPADSPSYPIDAGSQAFTFRLKRGQDVAATLLDPAGKPAAGVTVALVLPGNGMQVLNGQFSEYDRDLAKSVTGPDGRFSFPPQTGHYLLLALDKIGTASVSDTSFKAGEPIRMRAWATVEGVAMIGSKPAAGQTISADVLDDGNTDRAKMPSVYFRNETQADDAGRFRFDRLTSDKVFVGRRITLSDRSWTTTATQKLTPEPGKTTTVRLGGVGRPVTGRIEMPPELAKAEWGSYTASLQTKEQRMKVDFPADFAAKSPKEQMAWYADWIKSDAGKAFIAKEKEQEERRKFYNFAVARDGTFRVDDVEPGTYAVSIQLYKPLPGDQCGMGEELATASGEVVVPAVDNGTQSDEPAAVPTMVAVARRTVAVGANAPDFSVPTLDGKTVRLSDFRGKYVVLDFWATWCGPCVAEVPNMKATYGAFAKDERFAMLSLSLDDKIDAPKAFVKAQNIAWPQGFLGEWNNEKVTAAYGVRGIPSVWLIGPDGKVVAKDLRGDALSRAVKAALEK